VDDVFRNQFRPTDGAPKGSLALVDWGLAHIDRLRQSRAEERAARRQQWATIVIPVLSLFIVLLTLGVNSWLQVKSMRAQNALRQYEISLKPKQVTYSRFMSAVAQAGASAAARDKQDLLRQFAQMDQAFYLLAPFLDGNAKDTLARRRSAFTKLCNQAVMADPNTDAGSRKQIAEDLGTIEEQLAASLYQSLFANEAVH
jgi:hypothetical protein